MFNTQKFTNDLLTRRLFEGKISINEAAKQIGISGAAYARLERGKIPALETLTKCSIWLGINLYILFKIAKNGDTELLQKDLLNKRLLKEKITIHKAAKQMDVSRNVLARLEHGNLPSVENLVKCFAWLNKKDIDYFQDSS